MPGEREGFIVPPSLPYAVQPASNERRPAREMGLEVTNLPYSQPWYRPHQIEEALGNLDRQRKQVEELKQVVRTVTRERTEARTTSARAMEITRNLQDKAATTQQVRPLTRTLSLHPPPDLAPTDGRTGGRDATVYHLAHL